MWCKLIAADSERCGVREKVRDLRPPRVCLRTMGFLPFFVSLIVFTAPVKADTYSMAGTFNGWNPQDTSRTLKQLDPNKHELVRYWKPGRFEFKFARNGGWDRNLGVTNDGKLAPYACDIDLTIPIPGEYRIAIDTQALTWTFNMQPPTQPRALFSYRWIGANVLRLDAGRSLARKSYPLTSFEWSVAPEQRAQVAWNIIDNGCVAELTIHKPGHLDVDLTISDGSMSDRRVTKLYIPQTYALTISHEGNDKSEIKHILFLIDGHRYGHVIDHAIDEMKGEVSFLVTNPFNGTQRQEQTLSPQDLSDKLILFNDLTKKITINADGFQRFRYVAKDYENQVKPTDIDRVVVVADFNGWHAERTPLRETKPGVYEAIALLPDGRYEYKFLVNGVTFLEDRTANPQYRDPDDLGGFNSGFIIGPDAGSLGPAKSNHINLQALRHNPAVTADFTCMSKNIVDVTVKTLANDVQSVAIVSSVPTFDGQDRVALRKTDTINGFDYWRARLKSTSKSLDYHFEFKDDNAAAYLSAAGATDKRDAVQPWQRTLQPTFPTPDWAKHALWYQIFPERFRNGDASNDPPRTAPWQHEWYKPYKAPADVTKGAPNDFNESGNFYSYIYSRRYGGDIQGVREQLPYLRKLGVTAIYFNPIFLAQSLHKYDASDFRHIEDFFGVKDSLKNVKGETTDPNTWQWSASDRVFLDFLEDAHAQGFKVIIDGVFNHVGRDFWAFRDVLKNGKDSPYADWFDIVSWEPFQYKAWDAPNGSLPRLKHDDDLGLAPVVREHIFAITRRWMDPNGDGDPSDGIDGWRLDVAEDINEHFWSDWRKLVKEINPDAYIVAEIWHEAREWLDGRTFDAVMNYPFAEACQRYFVNDKKASTPQHFARELNNTLHWYPPQVTQVLQNLFDSHDTDRVASMLMNPDLEYDKANRLQDNGPNYDASRPTEAAYQKLMLMVGLQMTFPNAPMIYYGDEVGMYGADDPSDRKPMYWPDLMPFDDPDERIHEGLFEHYRFMIALRNTYEVLRVGTFTALDHSDSPDVFAFKRSLNNQTALVAINRGKTATQITLPAPWKDGTELVRVDPNGNAKLIEPDEPSRRATVSVKPDAPTVRVADGQITLELSGPYSMMVLLEKP